MSHDVAMFSKYCLIMGHHRKTKATLIDFLKKSTFVVHGSFEPRWPKIMQPYTSWFAVMTFLKCCSKDRAHMLDKSNSQYSQRIPFLEKQVIWPAENYATLPTFSWIAWFTLIVSFKCPSRVEHNMWTKLQLIFRKIPLFRQIRNLIKFT